MANNAVPNFAIPLSAANITGRVNQHIESKPHEVNIDHDEWELGLYLDSDELGYDIGAIGFKNDAVEGWDENDFPHIPQFAKYLKIDFGEDKSRDFRSADSFKSWTFTIPSNLNDKAFTLEWDRPVSDQYTVMLFDGHEGKLYDLKEKEKISIANNPEAKHQFLFGSREDIFQKIELERTILVSLYPNPGRDMLNLDLVSSVDEEVSVSLVSLAGKTVHQSMHQTTAGMNRIQITLINELVPVGMYILSIDGSGFKKMTSKVIKQ